MARKRMISPEFFMHYGLVEAERASGLPLRLGFAGLWCQADKFGRFRWRPKSLKPAILPYEDVDFARVLEALEEREFIRRYEVDGEEFGFIPSWPEWQTPHHSERLSTIPAPRDSARATVLAPLGAPEVAHGAPPTNGDVCGPLGGSIKEPLMAQGTDAVAVTDTDAVAVAVPPAPIRPWKLEGDPTTSATPFCQECGDGEQFVLPGEKRQRTRHRSSCSHSPWAKRAVVA